MFIARSNPSRNLLSAEEVVSEALTALAAGDTNSFLECVDVKTFVFKMDSTGLTLRDYEHADRERKAQLESSHSELLARDFLVTANLQKKFEISGQEIKDNSASFSVRPWIQFGSKLYRQILLEKKGGRWRISGLAAPDF